MDTALTSSDAAYVKRLCHAAGAFAAGIACAQPLPSSVADIYDSWLALKRHGTMFYAGHHRQVRNDPRLLLDGARSIIVCLFAYPHSIAQTPGAPLIAAYAAGRDYHKVLRKRLKHVAALIDDTYHVSSRVCVDTAPLRERFWAARAGLGVIGLNNQLIVPGIGSNFFIASVITSADFPADTPLSPQAAQGMVSCLRCGRCVKACPAGAINPDGSCDTQKCLSYITIEADDDIVNTLPRHQSPLKNHIYGCDVCRLACPMSHPEAQPAVLPDFSPRPQILSLTLKDWLGMTHADYDSLTAGSAMRRASLLHLKALLHFL